MRRLTSFVEATTVLLLGMLGARERVADQPVGHVERGIGETGLLVDQQRHQGGAPPVGSIAVDPMGEGGRTLAGELLKAAFRDARRGVGIDAEAADEVELVDQITDVPGLRQAWDLLHPGKPGEPRLWVDHQQLVEGTELFVRQSGEQRFRHPLAGAGATRGAGALDHRCKPAG